MTRGGYISRGGGGREENIGSRSVLQVSPWSPQKTGTESESWKLPAKIISKGVKTPSL